MTRFAAILLSCLALACLLAHAQLVPQAGWLGALPSNGSTTTPPGSLPPALTPDLLWYSFTNNAYSNAPTVGTVEFADQSSQGGAPGYLYQFQARAWELDPYGGSNAAHFSGARTLIYVPNSVPRLSFTNNSFTIEFWFQFLGAAGWPILYDVDGFGNGYELAASSSDSLTFTTYNQDSSSSVLETHSSIAGWTFVAIADSGGTNCQIYINGYPDPNQNGTTISPAGQSVADFEIGNTNGLGDIDGNIYTLAVWGEARSPAQILNDYNRFDPNVTSNLLSRWTGHGTANDTQGNHNGTWVGAPSYTNDMAGRANSAFNFTGSNYIDTGLIGNSALFPNGFTVNLWMQNQSPANTSPLSDDTLSDNSGMVEVDEVGGQSDFRSYIPDQVNGNSFPATTNAWYMLTVVWAPNNAYFTYINGGQLNSPLFGRGPITSSGQSINLGRRGTWQTGGNFLYFTGQVSEVSIYTNELPQAKIGQLYYNGTNGCHF
jgi:hypothetical protein